MKKKILIVFALFALILSTSCTNADIEHYQTFVPSVSDTQSATQGVGSKMTI